MRDRSGLPANKSSGPETGFAELWVGIRRYCTFVQADLWLPAEKIGRMTPQIIAPVIIARELIKAQIGESAAKRNHTAAD